MLARLTLILLLLAALPSWCQVEPGATGSDTTTESDEQMMVPPPVAGVAFPNVVSSENLPNYVSAGITASGGYIENVLPAQNAPLVNAQLYSIYPTLAVARSTPYRQVTASYSPSFLFYEPGSVSVLNTINHGASMTFQDRLSPHITFNVEDFFYRTSDVYDQSYLFSGGVVTGSTQTPSTIVIAPFEQQLSNLAHGFLTYQFAEDGMIGGGASDSTIYFSAPSASTGLGNSHSDSAWAFYNRRFSGNQYIGFSYQWTRTAAQTTVEQTDTEMNSLLPFYSFYFSKTTSISISGGEQHVEVTAPVPGNLPTLSSWEPTADVSLGYQGERGYLAASYSYTVISGQGLLGAFNTNGANLSAGWNPSRTWTAGLTFFYANTSNATPLLSPFPGGTTVSGQVLLSHSFRESLVATVGYERIHEDYPEILSANTDSNQVYGRITYQFKRNVGK
jgi:hypothetical protein